MTWFRYVDNSCWYSCLDGLQQLDIGDIPPPVWRCTLKVTMTSLGEGGQYERLMKEKSTRKAGKAEVFLKNFISFVFKDLQD